MHSIRLRLLEHAIDDDVNASVLDELGRAIRKCEERLDKLRFDDDTLEFDLIESLLGTAYVVCQTMITNVVARATEILAMKPHEIRAMGPRFDVDFSKVEVLWALGNYFKHRDEWEVPEWDTPTGPRSVTIPVLKAAGLLAMSSGNLRTGAAALGNIDYYDMAVFQSIVNEWAAVVTTAARSVIGGTTPDP